MAKYVELLKSVSPVLAVLARGTSSLTDRQKLSAVNDEASKKYLAELEGE